MSTAKNYPGLRSFTPTKIKLRDPVPSDIDIAQEAELKPIAQVVEEVGLRPDEIELHGNFKAKVRLDVLKRLKDVPDGIYVDVTAITPTPLGEGKSTTMVGLTRASSTCPVLPARCPNTERNAWSVGVDPPNGLVA